MPVLHDPDSTPAHWPARTGFGVAESAKKAGFYGAREWLAKAEPQKCFFAANLEDLPAGSPAFPLRTSSPGLGTGLLRAAQKVTLTEDDLSPPGHIVAPAGPGRAALGWL